METNQTTTFSNSPATMQERDEMLWQVARKRASFKTSLLSYVLVNTMLVTIWYLSSGSDSYFWPVWPILGWGFGLTMQYFGAYHRDVLFSTDKEYEKLKNQQNN